MKQTIAKLHNQFLSKLAVENDAMGEVKRLFGNKRIKAVEKKVAALETQLQGRCESESLDVSGLLVEGQNLFKKSMGKFISERRG